MPNAILAALSSEEVLQSRLSAVLTADYVIVTSPRGGSHIVISLERLSEIKTLKTTYPGLLVIASGAFLIAAAAYCSKQGDGAALPSALIGLTFVIAYFCSRRASIAFVVDGESAETASGGLRDAAALVRAVEKARVQREYPVAKRSEQGESFGQWLRRVLGLARAGRASTG
jgi:hypothetical protein